MSRRVSAAGRNRRSPASVALVIGLWLLFATVAAHGDDRTLELASAEPAPKRAALLGDRRFEIALLQGSHAVWQRRDGRQTLVFVRRDGVQRALIRPRVGILRFNWMQRGRAVHLVLERDPSTYVVSPDGSLGSGGGDICTSSPDPAQDGTHLECADTHVYFVRGGKSQLVAGGLDDEVIEPALSPSGDRVVFVRIAPVGESTLWMFSTRTRRSKHLVPVLLSPYRPSIHDPVWSPNGRRIAFWAASDDNVRESVFLVNADGTGLRRLVANGARPTWSPDGEEIAFDRRRAGRRQVYIKGADGTAVRQETFGRQDSWAPRWRLRP